MIKAGLDWLGFGEHGHDGHGHHHASGHGHSHGVVDPAIAATEQGMWAIKWSFAALAATALAQAVVVWLTGSVALLADTIHNVGDAATAVPLYIAFRFARRAPTTKFTYGFGRVEDLAGMAVVALILFSALVAGYQAVDRLLNPRDIDYLGAVAAAGLIGFAGNEMVAVFRIRVGRAIASAALVADGYHARVDGLTSLAVVLGAAGVWLGFPLADPVVGLVITVMIFGIVWQSAKAVFTRMLDGVEPGVVEELTHAAGHVPGVRGLAQVRARWVGHRLHAEAELLVDTSMPIADGVAMANAVRAVAAEHLPALGSLRLTFASGHGGSAAGDTHGHSHGGQEHSHEFLF